MNLKNNTGKDVVLSVAERARHLRSVINNNGGNKPVCTKRRRLRAKEFVIFIYGDNSDSLSWKTSDVHMKINKELRVKFSLLGTAS